MWAVIGLMFKTRLTLFYILKELVKSGPVVLAFFPKAFTSGWNSEFEAYRSGYAKFSKLKTQVFGISTDDVETLKKFQKEIAPNIAFIADPDGKLSELYDVKTPLLTYAKRYTFVIGADQKLRAVLSGSDALDPSKALSYCGQ